MLREAGLSPNYLKEGRPRGRRLDTLAAIAHALDWTIDEITSLADERSPTGPLNFDYLAAVRVTLAVFESALVPEDIPTIVTASHEAAAQRQLSRITAP